MPPYLAFMKTKVKTKLLLHFFPNFHGCSGNFSVSGYLSLIRKDSATYIHGLAVYVKEGLPFAQDLPLENSVFLFMF